MASFLDNAVDRVTIETEWLPPIVLEKPLDSKAPLSAATRFLKPRITIYNPYTAPVVLAPAGQPVNNWPYMKVIIGLTALLAGVTVWDFAKGKYGKKRKGVAGLGCDCED